MREPDFPKNEIERQEAVEETGLLNSKNTQEFDTLTELCAEITQSPISLITLLDNDRNWFKSHYGIDFNEDSRENSFCGHAINSPNTPFVIPDTTEDERFFDNPLVTGENKIRFYAGIPILSEKGLPLGTLCVFDKKPKKLSDRQLKILKNMAIQAGVLMDHFKKEKQLSLLTNELIDANENLKLFAKAVAHDLRSPAVHIEEMVKIYQKKYTEESSPKQLEILGFIKSAASKLKDLVEGTLAFNKTAKILKNKKKEVYLSDSVDYARTLADPKGISKINRSERFDLIRVNDVALKRILINIFSNSIKYSDKEKVVVDVSIRKVDDFHLISISDNGPGIHPDFLEDIFAIYERGEQEESAKEGVGVGLATVKRLVIGMGGKIEAKNNKGEGVTFSIYLPS